MGGIVIIVKGQSPPLIRSEWRWAAHASDVADFMNLRGIPALSAEKQGDSHNGTISIDAEQRKIIVDSDYFFLTKEAIRFWRCIGFDVLGRLKDEVD